jgi:ubiquitin C-terminal hydrolase
MSAYYCDRSCQESHWPFHKGGCTVLATIDSTSNTSTTTTPTNGQGQGIATRQQRAEESDGRVGLNNIGNTCFMNSALQCLSHATPLTRLFLSNKFRTDLNTTNPLGTGGKLVHAYEIVMKDLWMRLTSGSTSPTTLKRAIALFAPRFAGCLQHDTQEFLAYLLDGLHEDLNRIRKAPYVEMPDVTDGQNMAVASARAWDAHQRRNNSLLMDTFYGQFKSTCVCPKCNRVSVAFDTFNHVSLEIPQVKNAIVAFQALVFRAPTPDAPATKAIRYGLELRRSDRVGDLKQALSAMCGIPADQLMLCEAQNSRISDLLNDNLVLSKLRSSDLILAYEADPVTDECYHAIASHRLVDPSVDPADEKKIAASVDNFFGFPFLSSFSTESTCRQVWEHVWRYVGCLVESGLIKREDAQDLLKVRFTDGRGIPQLVFPPLAERNVPEDESLSGDRLGTCVLPKDSDEKLVTFLGEESTSRFLFMTLDWRDPEVEHDDNEAKKTSVLDEDRFVAFENHPSFVEVMEKQRAIKATNGVTLAQCFDTFTKPERLDEDNMWYCSECKEHVRAMKTMELWRLPNILVVHLKRFEFKHALRRDKLDTLVDFPLEGLDMSVHCAVSSTSSFVDKTVPADYDLFAVTNHFGRMGFGHYTAYARRWDESGISDNWDLFDDSNVRSVGDGMGQTASVVSPAAYVLFYRRRIFH